MNDGRNLAMSAQDARTSHGRSAQALASDLDDIVSLAVDQGIAARLQSARRAALARLNRSRFVPSAHWINWAPAALALALVMATSWTLLADNAQSLDADLLADSLPFDAYLDADFEASISNDSVELIEN